MKEYRYEINDRKYRVRVKEIVGDVAVVQVNDRVHNVLMKTAQVPDAKSAAPTAPTPTASSGPRPAAPRPTAAPAGSGVITSPMPGVMLTVKAGVADLVNAADVVMVIEAMKMENDIKASVSGDVKKVLVKEGDSVNTGDQLVLIDV